MELACPQCGATNREDSVDFPFCTHCHEPLVKCGYCAHFDVGGGICRHPKSGRRKVSADDQLDCPSYRSILAVTVAFGQRVISPAKWVLLVAGGLAAVIMVGKIAQGRYVQAGITPEGPLPIRVEARWRTDSPIVAGRSFRLEFRLDNPYAQASGSIRLAIPAAFLDRFKVLAVDPRPSRPPELRPSTSERERRYWHYYDFPSVPFQGQRVITFTLVTRPDFAKTGFPFQQDRYAYDLNGTLDDKGVRHFGVHVYNSGVAGKFSAHRILKIEVKP